MSRQEILKPPGFIPPKQNTAAYDMIRGPGRKTWNVVRGYIEHYTKLGEIVFDPFGGTGPTIVEALKIRRKVLYNDLNPFMLFIARNTCRPVNTKLLTNAFNRVLKAVKDKKHPMLSEDREEEINVDWLYVTKCPLCRKDARIMGVKWSIVYTPKQITDDDVKIFKKEKSKAKQKAPEVYKIIEKNKKIMHEEIVRIAKEEITYFTRVPWAVKHAINGLLKQGCITSTDQVKPVSIEYECEKCGSGEKKLDKKDLNKIIKICKIKPKYHYPEGLLEYPSGERFLTRRRVRSIRELFTRRNLIALTVLKHEIEQLDETDEIKETLLFCFAAILEHVSKMQRPSRKGQPSKEYWVPYTFLETNVLEEFRKRFREKEAFGRKFGIITGKKEANDEIGDYYQEASSLKELIKGDATVFFLNEDTRELSLKSDLRKLNSRGIDYVFTDPSYGDSVQYGELTFMARSWLKMPMNYEKEIIVNPKQGKSSEKYEEMLCSAFGKVFEALKPGGYMTVTFHSREAKFWNALLHAISMYGFEYIDALYQPKQREYSNWVQSNKPGAMKGDIYITFRKPIGPQIKLDIDKEVDIQEIIDNIIIPEARKVILERGGEATYDQLVRSITLRLLTERLLHRPELSKLDYAKVFDEYLERA